MRYTGVLLMSDIDGTLLNAQRRMSRETREALVDFLAHGGRFTVATGRIPATAETALCGIMPSVPGVCYNGGIVYDFSKKQVIQAFPFEPSDEKMLLSVMEDLHAALPEISINVDTLSGPAYLGRNAMTDRICRMLQWEMPRYLTRADERGEPLLRIALGFDKANEAALQDFLAKQNFAAGIRLLRTDKIFYELIPRYVNKAYAVTQTLWPYEGVDTLVYVGDSENDVEMLQLADYSFVPANAMPSACKAAKEILPVTNDENAVAEVIARL